MRRAYVLLSGGADSTTCLYLAAREWPELVGVSVYYGQRHSKELESAAMSCRRLHAKHHVLDLRSIVPKTMLTDPSQEVPNISYAEINGVSPTYVPFRNGLMLSAATSWIQGQRTSKENVEEWALYFGAHAEDARNDAYPDCSFHFTGAMANAIYVGTYRQLRLIVPLQWMVKSDIIRLGQSLGVPWEDTFSCYKGEQLHCGVCPTCRSRRQGFIDAGVPDPTVYAQSIAA